MTQETFPTLKPSSRSFESGDYPVKAYQAQNGAERRILYGNKRVGMKMQLVYQNITDAEAEQFLDHFDHTQGTFDQFTINTEAKAGWAGNLDAIGAVEHGSEWRYANSPQLQSVYPGISTITINLIGATTS